MSEQKHWIEDDTTRKKFWAYAKSDLGLNEDEVHDALGVASTKQFGGDKTAAMALLQNFAAGIVPRRARLLLDEQEVQHAEARVIAFCDLYAPNGARISLTAREGAKTDDLVATALALTDAAEMLVNVFGFSGAPQKYTPGGNGYGQPKKTPTPAPTRPTPPPAPVCQSTGRPGSGEYAPPPQPDAPPSGNGSGGTETFLVDSVTAQVSPNGNRYYAVKGGRVKKHGATAWPEVAEPQLEALTEYNPVNLEIGKPWDVAGFGIRAVGEIPPGKTYPSKITAFAPST